MVSVPWYYRESVTPKVIQELLLTLRDSEDFPSNYHLEWENLEVKDPITFARKTLWAACVNINDGKTCTWHFWSRMTDEIINICMEEYKKIAVEKEFRNFIFRGSSATFQVC